MKKTLIRVSLIAALAVLPVSSVVGQVTINWGTPLQTDGTLSNGTRLPAGFSFELGTFDTGFSPLLANASDWASNFNVLDASSWVWNGAFGQVQDSGSYSSYPAPISSGEQLFIWGFNSQAPGTGTEWILLSNASWTVPAITPVVYNFFDNQAGTQTVAGIGQLLTGGSYLAGDFRTSSVIPEPATYAAFVGAVALLVVGFRRFRRR
jgi:hypothetical protein